MRRAIAIALAAPALAALAVAAPARGERASAGRAEFVRVRGTELVAGGRPLRFAGANAHIMHGAAARARAEATLRAIAGDGLKVVRLWALGEGFPGRTSAEERGELWRVGPDGWNPEAAEHLRSVLDRARDLGLYAIVTLANHWRDYGGIPAYLRWAGHQDWDAYGWRDRFFTDQRTRAWYFDHVRRVVGPLRDHPAVLAWELFNESHGTPEAAGARLDFYRDAMRLVRSLDPDHLVVPGTLGYARGAERDEWVRVCRLPEAAFCNQHVYPQHGDRIRTFEDLGRFLDDRVQLAHHVARKPVVFGEFGHAGPGAPGWYRALFSRLALDGAAGALAWIYQPDLGWERDYGILFERPESGPVRAALREGAAAMAAADGRGRNPAIGPRAGRRPLFPLRVTRSRRAEPIGGWTVADGAARLAVPVGEYALARWEDLGVWSGILVHAWGAGHGLFEYRFEPPPALAPAGTPAGPARRWRVRARLSSEYPGRVAPPDGAGTVRVSIDGRRLGEATVPADDGKGEWRSFEGRARAGRAVHALRFEVPAGRNARGLCIYGEESPDNREPVAEAGPITVEALP